jgi:hypothetical protein
MAPAQALITGSEKGGKVTHPACTVQASLRMFDKWHGRCAPIVKSSTSTAPALQRNALI